MTEILAHDIDGRPLRAGDRVVLVSVIPEWAGTTAIIVGKTKKAAFLDEFFGDNDNLEHDDGLCARASDCRRLDADHTPAETGFTELMTNLKTGSLEPLEIE